MIPLHTTARRAGLFFIGSIPMSMGIASMLYKDSHRINLPQDDNEDQKQKPQRCVITGGTSGIGFSTASELVKQGCCQECLVLGVRNLERGNIAKKRIQQDNNITKDDTTIQIVSLDLAEKDSVTNFVKNISKEKNKIDLVISSAAEIQNEKSATKYAIDTMFATNHLGLHQLLNEMKESNLFHTTNSTTTDDNRDDKEKKKNSSKSRIVIVGSRLESKGQIDPSMILQSHGQKLRSSVVNKEKEKVDNNKDNTNDEKKESNNNEDESHKKYNPMDHYADTKLMNQLLITELVKNNRWSNSPSIDIVSVSPGMVHTNLWRHFPMWYQILTYPIRALALREPEDAGKAVVYAATKSNIISGSFLKDGYEPIEPSKAAQDTQLSKKLYDVCEILLSDDEDEHNYQHYKN